MELSKEVHTLLERIKKLSQHAQKNDTSTANTTLNMPYNLPLKVSQFNLNSSQCDDIQFSMDELINVENMDFSDNERWLYVSEMSMISPYTGDLTNWLHQDFNTVEDDISELESLNAEARRNFVDTRTFTRPKKRISRPSLEQLTEGYYSQSSSKTSIHSEYHDVSKMSLTEESSNESYHSDYLLSNTNSVTGPVVQFKLSEPVNISFDRILANASETLDSFTNMSPPSLINSLCSSTFTNLMDSGYQPEIVPNLHNSIHLNSNINSNENDDPNVTFTSNNKTSSTMKDKSLNDTYEIKNINNLSATNTNTITKTKKSRLSKLSTSLKSSCPDINRTFEKGHSRDSSLDLTFQKLSDSQPNLTEDLKRTIFNQSMELMNPTETYHSARSGSADSLDERSSSISNSSKDSATKIMNMGDLDSLARAQELRLHQAMSTPKPSKSRMLLLDTLSPIPVQNHHVVVDEEFLSDSDLSDTCVTARSGTSKPPSAHFNHLTEVNSTKSLPNKPEVRKPSLRTLPTMIVKPMEVNRTVVEPNRTQSLAARPKIRSSGLPRPTSTALGATGIPRPSSRIPGPKSLRPPSVRPQQQQQQLQQKAPSKTNWMDGCY